MICKEAKKISTIIELLRKNAYYSPDKTCLTFLNQKESIILTNKALLEEVEHLARRLLTLAEPGSRAIILLNPGIDYIVSFLGCLLAGIIAVPAYPPTNSRHNIRLLSIIEDACVQVIITTSVVIHRTNLNEYSRAQVLVLEEQEAISPSLDNFPVISSEDLAFLQYTSGSTGNPKGVMVSHGNIIANVGVINSKFEGRVNTLCSWIPPFHDMGMIGCTLFPLAYNLHLVFMSPTDFLKNPFKWLKAISDFRAECTAAPDFAYELCARVVTDSEKKELDLSQWLFAINGSEPVNAWNLERFSAAFKECGFREEFLHPAYGMAETTLMITTKKADSKTTVMHVEKQAFQDNTIKPIYGDEESVRIVGCGTPHDSYDLRIIDPSNLNILPVNKIGEIVVRGTSVTKGYWNKPELNQEFFHLKLDSDGAPFLRTGDLGFLDKQGELFITGRLKDLIIIRGQNLYPQDIEHCIESSHPMLMKHGGAAFALAKEHDEPELILIHEVHRSAKNFNEIFSSILDSCSQELPILPSQIVLIKQSSLPRTSSGKVQRGECRQAFLANELQVSAQWQRQVHQKEHTANPTPSFSKTHEKSSLILWMKQWIANNLSIQLEQVDIHKNFSYYGMDSVTAVQFSAALGQLLDREINPSFLWSYTTVDSLAHYLLPNQNVLSTPNKHHAKPKHFEPIAIIGMGCRFPGSSNSPQEFWELLQKAKDGITKVPANRWDYELYADRLSPYGGFVDNIEQFDASLFNVNAQEAISMDPQHRFLLEVTWEALEHAGISPLSLNNSPTAVFIGIASNDYGHLDNKTDEKNISSYYGLGNAHSAAAGRLAYFLGTKGEASAVDTACSSSLVAVFKACQDLQDGQCDMAIAGGVNTILDPSLSLSFANAGMLSRKGRCQVFDAHADGYVRSEGCGILILKRLADAQQDGDNILAVIRSAVVNSDGHSNGITAPNPEAQKELLQCALDLAQLSPNELDYIETHGTGTSLGDPIEFNAIKEVFATGTRARPLFLGAVKSNVGHLEAAAGMAGLIKTILMIQNKKIPANLHFKHINPLIDLKSIPAQIPTRLLNWGPPEKHIIRQAGISSFGFTGTNAHLILSEPLPTYDTHGDIIRPLHLFTLSGHSSEALEAQRSVFLKYIQHHPSLSLSQLCHTTNLSRSDLPYRLALCPKSMDDLILQLEQWQPLSVPSTSSMNKVAFLFTGQGSQYTQMGLEFYETHSVFKEAVDYCCSLLDPELEFPLLEVMFHPERKDLLNQTQYTQLSLFVLEYALATLWLSLGVQPAAVMGHSVGEYVAAIVAQVMTLEQGIKLIAARAKLTQQQQPGSMLVLYTSSSIAESLIAEIKQASPQFVLCIAAINTVNQVVLSGDSKGIAAVINYCQQHSINTVKLPVSHAFHSELLLPMVAEFGAVAEQIEYSPPSIMYVSNRTGEPVTQINGAYWVEHLLKTVQFSLGVHTLMKEECNIFIEIGPNPILLNFVAAHYPEPDKILCLSSMQKNKGNWEHLANSLCTLYLQGYAINWRSFDEPFGISHCPQFLPGYRFQHQPYWLKDTLYHEKNALERLANQSLYELKWKKIANLNPEKRHHPGKHLVFIHPDAKSVQLAHHLVSDIDHLLLVHPGQEYQETDSAIVINPMEPEHFHNLWKRIPHVEGIIYLWGLPNQTDVTLEVPDEVYSNIRIACSGLLHLTQTMIQNHQFSDLYVITQGASSFFEDTIAFGAPLVGMGKTLITEYPQLSYYHIDFDPCIPVLDIAEQFLSIDFEHLSNNFCAVSFEGIFESCLTAVPISKSSASFSASEQQGAYLITGGMGGLGLSVCRWLLNHRIKNIVLLGRSPLSNELKSTLQELNQGLDKTAVHYMETDISVTEQLSATLRTVQSTIAPIKAIFHLAGVLQDGIWPNLNWGSFDRVFQSKVLGTLNLHQQTLHLNLKLDYFVMFSSISSLIGTAGQANYAAANAFIDALAYFRKQLGLPALSINFGPWQQMGMTKDNQGLSHYGIQYINEKQGLFSLQKMLPAADAQLVLLPNHINKEHLNYFSPYQRTLLVELIQEDENEEQRDLSHPTRPQKNLLIHQLNNKSPEEREGMLTHFLETTVRKLLRLPNDQEFIFDKTLTELGMDSILANELLFTLKRELCFDSLSAQTLLFEGRTIANIAHFLNDEIKHHEIDEREEHASSFKQCFPLVPHQAEMMQYINSYPFSAAYNLPVFIQISGIWDAGHIQKAVQQIINNNEMLRASILTVYDQYFHFIQEQVNFTPNCFSITEAQLHDHLLATYRKPINLDSPPLFNCDLYFVDNQKTVVAFVFHHVIADGASIYAFIEDFIEVLQLGAYPEKKREPFSKYVHWLLKEVYPKINSELKVFWENKLNTYNERHLFNPDFQSKQFARSDFPLQGAKVGFALNKTELALLEHYTAKNKITVASLLQAVVHRAFYDLTGKQDTALIVFSNARNNPFWANTIGQVAQHPTIRCQNIHEKPIHEMAELIMNELAEMEFHQFIPSFKLEDFNLQVPKISFDYQSINLEELMCNGKAVEFLSVSSSSIDLWGSDPRHLAFKLNRQKNHGLEFALKYRLDCYTKEQAQIILEQCRTIIYGIIS